MWLIAISLWFVSSAWPQDPQEEADGLQETLDQLQALFPENLESDALYRAALEGVVHHLGEVMGSQDNRVLTAEQLSAHQAWMTGARTGIGAEFSIVVGRGLAITEVFDEGPASTEGLTSGDLIVSMDNHPFTGLTRAAIHHRIQQSDGEVVVLDVRRALEPVRRVTIRRGAYRLPPVRTGRGDQIPMARISYFGTGTAEALAAFLEDHADRSAVVIDLRDNGDGLVDEVVESADLFLKVDSVILFRGRNNAKLEAVKADDEPICSSNVVVLVNRGTAGAAEAFTAALQEHKRAMVIGTRTGGVAMHTSHYPAGRGLVLEIADIHLRSPSGHFWGKTGLVPDLMVEAPSLSMPTIDVPIPPDLQRDAAIRLISTTGQH